MDGSLKALRIGGSSEEREALLHCMACTCSTSCVSCADSTPEIRDACAELNTETDAWVSKRVVEATVRDRGRGFTSIESASLERPRILGLCCNLRV